VRLILFNHIYHHDQHYVPDYKLVGSVLIYNYDVCFRVDFPSISFGTNPPLVGELRDETFSIERSLFVGRYLHEKCTKYRDLWIVNHHRDQ
jgi:hypothetical protein